MKISEEIKTELRELWIPVIYKNKIRSQRTRLHSLSVPETENKAEILHTLLGIELKVSNQRFSCPDLSTARYLRIFARLGVNEFAVPYDISRISNLADELESSWQRMLLLLDRKCSGKSPQSYGKIRAGLIRAVRNGVDEIGPGRAIPAFRKSTKHRISKN